MKIHKYCLQ